MFDLVSASPAIAQHAAWLVLLLAVAAALGAALGIIRPVRNEIVPRSTTVIHSQILLAIVGAMIMIVVAESLARAFAIVGAARGDRGPVADANRGTERLGDAGGLPVRARPKRRRHRGHRCHRADHGHRIAGVG